MSGATLAYVVVTPVRNDEKNLRSLADALAAQTVQPQRWIIANNGSTDSTGAAALDLESEYSWIAALDVATEGELMRGAPIVRAFHAALEELDFGPDVVVKLDADITFEADHFQRLLAAFEANPMLGIASGVCYERGDDNVWRQRHGTGPGVWGAVRAYRWACLQAILPLEERMGWDTLDLVKASVHGWEAKVLDDIPFRHHRPEGMRDGGRARTWAIQGRAAHYMGYRFSYLLVRTLYRSLHEPAAVALLWGYLTAALRREPTCADAEVRAYLRHSQSLRRLPLRIREARKPRAPLDRPSS
jgi:glycosyltransferase involved in cell wall biosynthesis